MSEQEAHNNIPVGHNRAEHARVENSLRPIPAKTTIDISASTTIPVKTKIDISTPADICRAHTRQQSKPQLQVTADVTNLKEQSGGSIISVT